MNVADPNNPEEIGSYTLNYANDIHVVDSLAYIAGGVLYIMNVINPTNPVEVGAYGIESNFLSVHVVDSLAYLADHYDGLRVINVTDPTNPEEIGFHNMQGYTRDVQVVDSLAFVTTEYMSGLHIINVVDPTSPEEIGFHNMGILSTQTNCLHVVDNYAYVTNGYRGLHIINTSYPDNLIEIGCYNTKDDVHSVYVVDSLAYVSDGEDGLYIIRYAGPIPAVPEIQLSSSEHDFGVVKIEQHSDWNLIISNPVNINLRVDSLNIESNFFTIFTPSLPQSFRDSSIEVLVRFSPSSQAREYTDTLFIYSNDPDERVLEVSLTGTGELAVTTIYPNPFKPYEGHTSINFSNVPFEGEILVYSLTGEKLWHYKVTSEGTYEWDGVINSGEKISSGFYYYLVKDEEGEIVKKDKFSVIR